jgi:proteic killer suppression protein
MKSQGNGIMIKSFSDKETEKIFSGIQSRKLPVDIQRTSLRKLKYINQAVSPEDLRVPPGNHFEALEGRAGVFSIRINNQWRITFTWNEGAANVKIEDYH